MLKICLCRYLKNLASSCILFRASTGKRQLKALEQSVVGSGKSTFCKKTRIKKLKTPKNQDLYLYPILNTEERKPFFNFQSPLRKLEKRAPFSHEKQNIFRICLRYKVKQLSWVIFISHESQKSWKETFLEFFQLFAFFFKVKKSRPFSSFFVWSFWADSCQIKAGIPIIPLNWQLSKMTGNCEQWIVTLIYNCSYVGALCVPAMFQDVGRLRQD